MGFVLVMVYISIYIGLIATVFYALGYQSDKKKQKLLFTDEELPTVSVLIPVFNEEKSIKRTLESITSSNYPEGKLEVIIIDDGSTDNSLAIAKSFPEKMNGIKVRVFGNKENGGKGAALNTGIKKSSSEIILSVDADTFIEPHSVRELMRYFKNPEVMCVSPSMLVHKPRGLLQRIQQAEYLFGIFLRKAFTSVNAVHVTPGAFSAYRRTFLDKYGYYDENNLTEDLELALRVQSKGYMIENCPNAPAYTIAMNTFKSLMIQRRRWYVGLMQNMKDYRFMFSPKYGDLGVFVLPIAWISIFFSVFMINYLVINAIRHIHEELVFLAKINFDFSSVFTLNKYIFEKAVFSMASNPVLIFLLFFAIVLGMYMKYATKKVGNVRGLPVTVALYFMFFALLFGFWWTVSIIYVLFNKDVSWR